MLRAIRAGGQTSCPWTLILHCQTARRHLAKDTAMPSVPTVKGMMHLAQGTSSSEMPWTTNLSQHVVLLVGSTVSRVSPPHQCLLGTLFTALGFLQKIPAFPWLGSCGRHPPIALHGRPVCVGFGNHPPMHCPHPGMPGPSLHWSDWTGHSRGC